MDDSSKRDRTEPEHAPQRRRTAVLISLRIEPGEPINGTLTTVSGEMTPTPFCGWMELIAAITAQREDNRA